MHSSGDMRPGLKKGKARKTDESVEICRNKADKDKDENPCKRCVCAIYRGFCLVEFARQCLANLKSD